jgi:hypothetical protein
MNVYEGILYGRTNTGTSGHVADPFGLFILKNLRDKVFVTNISTVDLEPIGAILHKERVQVGFLDSDIVVIIHLVYDDHVISSF